MGRAADWLREERRKVLGHWAAVCLDCGAARRWFPEHEDELPERCEACGGGLLHRCKACGEPFASAFAVACEECGAKLREPHVHGIPIRRLARERPDDTS